MNNEAINNPDTNIDGLSAKQVSALNALLMGQTMQQTAKTIDVSERTLYNWLREPKFQKCYRLARRDVVNSAIASLQVASSDAVRVMSELMNDTSEKGTTRLAAAKTIVESVLKLSETEDLELRLAALEAKLKQKS